MCQVLVHEEAVQLCSAATCVAACFPRGVRGGGLFEVYMWGNYLRLGVYSMHLHVGHNPPRKVFSLEGQSSRIGSYYSPG